MPKDQQQPNSVDQGINPLNGEKWSQSYLDILEKRKSLPVYERCKEICSLIDRNQFTVLVGETGSGKTTQVPQFLVNFFDCRSTGMLVGCTQPRRVAATSVATRVAQEMDVSLGNEVGYSIRFEEMTSRKTLLKYLTDGMLMREAMKDPLLSKYKVILLDEAHERTLATDILMGLLKEICAKRPELHVVIMSATLEAKKFQSYFNNCPLIEVSGRKFPVEIKYCTEPQLDYLDSAVKTCLQIHKTQGKGDILVFLTGEEEIEDACNRIRLEAENLTNKKLLVLPLYSSLPSGAQQQVFEATSDEVRKIVVSTNIAETSVTIDGIVFVIDPGYVKQRIYNPRIRVESLQVTPISKASADQRAGRAGRTQPGVCYRLYTEKSYYKDLLKDSIPEVLRTNLSSVVLQLRRIGVEDLVHFDFMDPPAPETMMRAFELLHYIGALDDEGNLTAEGIMMSDFPLDPQLAKVLIWGSQIGGCADEVLSIVSMLSVQPPFMRPTAGKRAADRAKLQFAHPEGDHLTLLNVYYSFQYAEDPTNWAYENYLNIRALKAAQNVRKQLTSYMQKAGLPVQSSVSYGQSDYWVRIRKSLLSGFFMQAAHLERNSLYATLKDNQIVKLHPSTVLTGKLPQWVMYNEFVLTSQHFIRTATSIEPEWLIELAPHYFDLETIPNCEAKLILERIVSKLSKRVKKNA